MSGSDAERRLSSPLSSRDGDVTICSGSAHDDAARTNSPHGQRAHNRAGQGEAAATWILVGLVTSAMLVTYTRLDPLELYHVSRDGLAGGLSRTLVNLNFPIALIAIALVLIAMDALTARAWWIGGPAIVLCAIAAFPGVVDDQDLDARPVNALPAIGVALAAGLTIAAARRSGVGLGRHLALDPIRWIVAVVVVIVALPWIFADLGVWLPEWVFIMHRQIAGADGTLSPAVHLGHHHGFDGAIFVVSAVLLSRPRLRSRPLATAAWLYVSLVFAYGLVNFGQDAWNEQLRKRGWVDESIPSAFSPALEPIWLVVLAIATVTALALRWEATHVSDRAEPSTVLGATPEVPAVPVHELAG